MIFEPKPFAEIAADMVERMRVSTDKVTDFNVGSVVRSLLEANATELDDYYQEMYFGLQRAIPAAIYIGFGFDIKPAVAASGIAYIMRTQAGAPITLEAGFPLRSPSGVAYSTDAPVVMDVDVDEVSVTITADQAGAAGNSGAGPMTLSYSEVPGLVAENRAVLSGGQDEETEEQRAERFAAFIQALARGTPASLEYGATLPVLYHPVTGVLSERVQRSAVLETPGHVELYIHNGSYGASDALVAAVQQQIDGERSGDDWLGGYRPTGMRVDVEVMADRPIDIELELSGTGSTAAVTAAIGLALRSAVHGDVLRPIDLINVALALDGVLSASVITPTSAITVGASEVLLLNECTITWVD